MIAFTTNIAGINMHDGPAVLPMIAENDLLTLTREPNNPVDANAVLVYYGKHKLGYIPAHNAARIAPFLDSGGHLNATLGHSGIEGNHIWAQIRVSEQNPSVQDIPQQTAPRIPQSALPEKTKTRWDRWVLGGLGFLFIGTTINMCADSQFTVKNTSATDSVLADTSPAKTAISVETGNTWSYSDKADKMNGTVYVAELTANNLLEFDFPHNGRSSANFTIRKKNGQTDVFLEVSKGQFMANVVDGGMVRIKFDNKNPVTYSILSPSDGSTEYILFNSTSSLIRKVKKSKRMIIESEFYQSGLKQMEFNVAGLKWNH